MKKKNIQLEWSLKYEIHNNRRRTYRPQGNRKLAGQIGSLKLVGSFENAGAAGVFMIANQVDLVFLDIQMPGISGIDLARQMSSATLIIFTTAYAEFAVDSYELDAVDYLLKPIRPDRFKKRWQKHCHITKSLFLKKTRIRWNKWKAISFSLSRSAGISKWTLRIFFYRSFERLCHHSDRETTVDYTS